MISLASRSGRHSVKRAWMGGWHGVQVGIGNEAIQKVELWANVVINEATSGADLIVPRQGAGVGQSARVVDIIR